MLGISAYVICEYCLFFFFLFFAGVDSRTDREGAMGDMNALLEFKKHITQDPLSLLKDWHPNSSSACTWTGIKCSIRKHPGRVVQISLENATLRGTLSPHVANLSFLQVFDIANSTISGQIPSSLCGLRRIKQLDLCMNFFHGPLPSCIGNLSSLQLLALCSNSLQGQIPPSLGRLKQLTDLTVFRNQFTGRIPSELGALPQVRYLDLADNNVFGAIPGQLGNITCLEHLGLGDDYLSGFIPCSLGRLYRLKNFFLANTNVTGSIPHCLSNLTALTVLDLSLNNLQGHIPAWLGSFVKLQGLSFFSNQLTGKIPQSWANISQLQILDLSVNRLTGTPPPWLAKVCSKLEILDLGHNYFTSGVSHASQTIPILETLCNCSGFIRLYLFENMLTGTLPRNIGSYWPNLQYFELSSNLVSGIIPQSIGNLSSLINLRLDGNILSGSIPSQVANLKSVQSINLGHNKLLGKIPTEISLLNQTLVYLHMYENSLSGSISASIGELGSLRGLRLHGNLLSGKIPSEIGNCRDLEDLNLAANNLTGTIPPEVAGLTGIVFRFDLSRNGLTGEVPLVIAKLQMAQFINLSSNQLSGNIAQCMESWLDVRQINLSFNKFSGNISSSIGNRMTQLQSLDLSHNNFTGAVPAASVFNLSYLHFLNFSYNNFDGEIPCLNTSSSNNLLKLTKWSFFGNPNLCGKCYGLRACQRYAEHNNRSHSNKNLVLKVVLGIVGALLLLVVLGILFLFRGINKSTKQAPRISENFLKLSVAELHRITDSFSASNLVGEGTHGKVYRGVLRSGEVVAVKCFSSTTQSGSEKSFRKECRALGKVRHRNILRIITVVWSDELKAVVMPFMGNGSLHSLLHTRNQDGQLSPLKLPIRLRMLRELAGALSYLHHDGHFQVIHCDIKPENVLLDDDMIVKLSDFAIASLTGDFNGSTSSSSHIGMRGSVGYIAPEYGIGESVSIKGDVYSFGVVALEIITRLKPTHQIFSGNLTLPQWISLSLEGKSGEERGQVLKSIIKTADEDGGGIEMDSDQEMSAMDSILMVGLRCTSQNALLRPNMKQVESVLQKIRVEDVSTQRTLPSTLEEVMEVVEAQPSLYKKQGESSTFSSE